MEIGLKSKEKDIILPIYLRSIERNEAFPTLYMKFRLQYLGEEFIFQKDLRYFWMFISDPE